MDEYKKNPYLKNYFENITQFLKIVIENRGGLKIPFSPKCFPLWAIFGLL